MNYLTDLQIEKAIKKLKNNEIVILPTDTIYGFSTLANNFNRRKINILKRSDPAKPRIILVSHLSQVPNLDTEKYQQIFDEHKGETILLNIENHQLGIRLIEREDLVSIIDEVGPIYSTSVNVSGDDFLSEKNEFLNFLSEENIFYVGKLANKSSRIYSTIEGKYLR